MNERHTLNTIFRLKVKASSKASHQQLKASLLPKPQTATGPISEAKHPFADWLPLTQIFPIQ